MKKVTLILLTACLICACGQKGPLVPPETAPPETTVTDGISGLDTFGITESLSSHI